jgi:NitT/TauT family transport system permease protein
VRPGDATSAGASMKRPTRIRIAGILVVLVAVELACRYGLISRFTLIPPSMMIYGLVEMLWSGQINTEITTTLSGIAIAAGAAIVSGFVLGALLHAWPRIRNSLDPLLATYYSVPTFVFYPMFIVFFGMNRAPIVIIGFLFGVVAMITNTLNGLDRVPGVLMKTARVMRLGRLQTTLRITLPSAAPYIFTGAKLAIAYSFVGVIGAEFILANTGLGYEIAFAFNNFDNVAMYSLIVFVILVVSAVNATLFGWERSLMRRRGKW